MGTRTRGYADYRVPEKVQCDPRRILDLLAATTPVCLAVEAYWQANAPDYEPDATAAWRVWEPGGAGLPGWWFAGPGRMSVRLAPRVAEIFAGARWRGFLTLPLLRAAHRPAFSAVAHALGGTAVLFVPDYAEALVEAADAGASLDDRVRLLEGSWGPVQGDLGEITPRVIAECDHCPPQVWYLDIL